MREHLCSSCETGKKSIELDCKNVVCPFVNSYKDGKCTQYIKIKDEDQTYTTKKN